MKAHNRIRSKVTRARKVRDSQDITPVPPISGVFSDDATIVLHSGDTQDGLARVPNQCVQLVITSPPYNIGKSYETVTTLNNYLDGLKPTIGELHRVLSGTGNLCWQVGNYIENGEVYPLDIHFYPIFKSLGFRLRNRIVWHFDHGLHASKRFSGRYEVLLWFSKTDDYAFNLDPVRVPSKYPGKTNYKPGPNYGKPSGNPLGKNPSDIWSILVQDWESGLWNIPNVKANHPEKTSHQCQFPIELVQRCVLALSNQGDWVLDPYSGVGSSLIAALMHDRRAMGCEKEIGYIELTKERIKSYYSGDLRIRPLGKPVHRPSGREKVSQIPESWRSNGLSIINEQELKMF